MDYARDYLGCSAFDGDDLIYEYGQYISPDERSRYTLNRLTPDGEVTILLEDMKDILGDPNDYTHALLPLDDGKMLIVTQNGQVFVLDEAGRRTFSDLLPFSVYTHVDLKQFPDGAVRLCCPNEMGDFVIAELNFDTGRLETVREFEGYYMRVFFGGEYDFLCTYTNRDGVWGCRFDNSEELLLDYVNSAVVKGEEQLADVPDTENLLFQDMTEGKYILYRKAEDIPLAELVTLTVAVDTTDFHVGTGFYRGVKSFRQAHPEVMVVLDDFAEYDTKEKPDGGDTKLTQDMVTGLYKPDILLGSMNKTYMKQAVDKDLCADLTRFMKPGDPVNPDNLFGCVKRYFDDGEGGMWGIATGFSMWTMVADRARLGQIGERGYWTVSDFLDYAEGLPEGAEIAKNFARNGIAYSFLFSEANGYQAFIDRENAACSFDSPEFIRALEYLGSLPEIKIDRNASTRITDEEIQSLRDGTRILESAYLYHFMELLRPELWFGTKDWTIIGSPAAEERAGAGVEIMTSDVWAVTNFSEHPDLAWELISQFFTKADNVPALKTEFEKQAAEFYDKQLVLYFTGGQEVWDKEEAKTEADLTQPGMLTEITPEDCARLTEMLDEVGVSYRSLLPDEVEELIWEEVSAYLAGVGSAEECAKKIQSRVGIWLSEHQ